MSAEQGTARVQGRRPHVLMRVWRSRVAVSCAVLRVRGACATWSQGSRSTAAPPCGAQIIEMRGRGTRHGRVRVELETGEVTHAVGGTVGAGGEFA